MSKMSVKEFFEDKNIQVTFYNLVDSSTVIKAANELGIDTNDIAKTLAFHLGDSIIVVVSSGNTRIDNRKYRDYFGTKARMLNFDEVEDLTGHPVGGVTPFGLKKGIKVYLDESLRKLDYVYPAAGSPDTVLKIKSSAIETIIDVIWIDVCSLK